MVATIPPQRSPSPQHVTIPTTRDRPRNQIKKHTRGERVFFVMKLWTPKNTILYGEGVGAIAPASVIEGSTIVVLELVEDAGTSERGKAGEAGEA